MTPFSPIDTGRPLQVAANTPEIASDVLATTATDAAAVVVERGVSMLTTGAVPSILNVISVVTVHSP